jgi:hypothetical protein
MSKLSYKKKEEEMEEEEGRREHIVESSCHQGENESGKVKIAVPSGFQCLSTSLQSIQ